MAATRSTVPLAVLLLLGCLAGQVHGAGCPDDPEVDLCDNDAASSPLRVPSYGLAVAMTLALRSGGVRHGVWLPLLAPLAGFVTPAAGMTCVKTCGDLKDFYKTEECCGAPEKVLSRCSRGIPCDDAEPQAPRDLMPDATGQMTPKAAVLSEAQKALLPMVNVHFHLGAEHKAEAYSDSTAIDKYDEAHDGRRPGFMTHHADNKYDEGEVRPGFMCTTSDLSEDQKKPYEFEFCKGDVAVGKTYEIHYVYSSAGFTDAEADAAGVDGIDDRIAGSAFNGRGLLNPVVVTEAQVFQIVQGAKHHVDDLLHGWSGDHEECVIYAGSTTGTSYNNEVCSPYSVTWHVDTACYRVSPEVFDNLCKQMKELYNLKSDLFPHGSRILVDSKYVVKSKFVEPFEK